MWNTAKGALAIYFARIGSTCGRIRRLVDKSGWENSDTWKLKTLNFYFVETKSIVQGKTYWKIRCIISSINVNFWRGRLRAWHSNFLMWFLPSTPSLKRSTKIVELELELDVRDSNLLIENVGDFRINWSSVSTIGRHFAMLVVH